MSKKKKYQYDVALSFAGENRDEAEKLRTALMAKGLRVFYDKDHKAYLWGKGQDEYDKIFGPDSRFVIPLISEHYKEKKWPRYEFSVALTEAKKRAEEFILPVRVDDTALLGLLDDLNYMDFRKDDVGDIADAVIAKWDATAGAGKRGGATQRKQVTVLSRATRHALGIIATAVFPIKEVVLKEIFPDVKWRSKIRVLSRKGLIKKKKYSWEVPKVIERSLLSDVRDATEFNEAWIKGLEPLKNHTDIAIMLSLHYMYLDKIDQAVCVSADMVERLEPNWWSGLYLTFLKGLASKGHIGHIKPDTRIRLYNAVGICLAHAGRNADAMKWFLKLRRYSSKRKNERGLGLSYVHCGAVYQKDRDWKKAKVCYENAIRYGKIAKDYPLVAHALNNLACIVAEGSFERAGALIKESISIKNRIKDYAGVVASYGNLGYFAACEGQYTEARKWFSKSKRKAKALGLRYFESSGYFNLGNVHAELGEFDDALLAYRQAYEIASKNDYIDILERCIRAQGMVCFEKGWFRKAELKFRRLFELKRKFTEHEGMLSALDGIGASLIKQRKMLEARKVLRKGLKLARELKDIEMMTKLSTYKALTYDDGKLGKAAIRMLGKEAVSSQKSGEYRLALELWITCTCELVNLQENVDKIERAFENSIQCFNGLEKNYEAGIRLYTFLHQWQWDAGDYQAAIKTLNTIENIAAKGRLLVDQCKAIDQRGVCLQELNRLGEAELAHKEALKLAKRTKDNSCIQTSLNNLGEVLRKRGRSRRAVRTYLAAEAICKALKDFRGEIATAHNRALALDDAGDGAGAETVLLQCRERARRRGLWGEYVRAWEGLANLSWGHNSVSVAVKRYKRALKEAKTHSVPERRSEIALNFARLLSAQGRHDQALEILRPFEGDFKKHVNADEYYLTLGELYRETEDMKRARDSMAEAKEHAVALGDRDGVAYYSAKLSAIYRDLEQPKLSDMEIREALANEDDPEGKVSLLIQRLKLLLEREDDAAQEVYEEAKLLARTHGLTDLLIDVHMVVGDYSWKGDYESKLNALKAYIVGMTECILEDTDTAAKVGSHMVTKLVFEGAQTGEILADLEKDLRAWLEGEGASGKQVMQCLLWPVKMARTGFPYRAKPNLLKAAIDKMIADAG